MVDVGGDEVDVELEGVDPLVLQDLRAYRVQPPG
jgi:hypothetical protein